MKDPQRNLRVYRNKVTEAKRRARVHGAICWFCKESIDLELPYQDRWAFTLHHLDPLAAGGRIDGPTAPAHRSCNSSYGDGTRANKLSGQTRVW